MSEPDCELQLQVLFAEPAAFPDAQAFQQRIRQRLRKRRRIRIAVLGTSGLLAGVVSLHTFLASDVLGQLHRALSLVLNATAGFGIYWTAVGILLLLALVMATDLDDDCLPREGARLE